MNSWCRWFLFCALTTAALAGCLPLAVETPPASPTPLPPTTTASPTPTVIWFPPTATFTPFPTNPPPEPTLEARPNLGEMILQDEFPAGAPWSTSQTRSGSALLGAGELTIAIQEEKAYIYSLRQEPVLGDFYLEITASPAFCQGIDEYGLLVRYTSPGDYYRFSVSCDGQVRMDRVYQNQASSPQPWQLSGAVPIGAPSRSRLAVWALGLEMRFFVNDEFQFSVRDPQLPSGQVGVFIRSTGGHLMTVNFTDLLVRQITP